MPAGHRHVTSISICERMYFTISDDKFNANTCIAFFEKLIKHFTDTKTHLVRDRHSVHKSKAVREWVTEHTKSIELHFLPPYAPHLNPDELVNADLKRQLADRSITNRAELVPETRSVLRSIQKGSVRKYLKDANSQTP